MLPLVVLDAAAQLLFQRPGTGDKPEATDEVHYRIVERYAGDKTPISTTDKTERLSAMEPWTTMRDRLLDMRTGELRRYRWTGVDGMRSDHFHATTATFIDEIELISITPHHDVLPEDLHIGTYPLSVRRKGLIAPLPGPLVQELTGLVLQGDRVVLDGTAFTPAGEPPLHLVFTLDQLRARIASAEATDAIAHGAWSTALAAADRAIAIDPSIDEPYVARARVLVAQHGDAVAALAPVIARNPVWLYAKLASDKALAPLLDTPPLRALVAATPGTLEATFGHFAVETEPTGRYVAIFDQGGIVDGLRAHCGTMTVLDRKTLAIAAELPAGACDLTYEPFKSQRAVAERTFRALGFQPTTTALEIVQLDHYQPWLQELRAGGRTVPRELFALPPRAQLDAGILVGDIAIVHWRYDSGRTEATAKTAWARIPPAPPPPAPAIHYIDKVVVDDAPAPSWPLAVLGVVALFDALLARQNAPASATPRSSGATRRL